MSLQLSKHPKELWILSLSELCERFAFWGIADLLVLYVIEYYQYSNENATHIYGIFTGFAAFLPFVGGFLADRFNNYQAPLIVGAIANALGCFLIAMGVHSLFILSLVLTAIGYGIFTPSLVTILGYTYRDKPTLRESGFSIYYASINVGVFLALLSLGIVVKVYGWDAAFFLAGIVQCIGLIPLIYYLVKHKKTYRALKEERHKAPEKTLTSFEKSRLFVLSIFCLASIFFWTAYNQAFSSMAIFAHDFMNREIFHFSVPTPAFLSTESLFLILLAPFLATLYAKLQKKNKDPSPAKKTALGLIALAICFFIMMLASIHIPSRATQADISWGYLVGAYFLMAVGEMLLAPIGLSAMTRLAPPKYTALSVGLWYLCIGVAFYLGGLLAGLMSQVGGLLHFFALFVIITIFPGLVLFFFSKKLTKMSHFGLHR